MRVLLDENIPIQLKAILGRTAVKSVNDAEIGWKNIKNGKLIAEMEGKFDLLITADQNLYAQQNLKGRKICILVLPTNKRSDVLAMAGRIIEVMTEISVGDYVVLQRSGTVIKASFDLSGDANEP